MRPISLLACTEEAILLPDPPNRTRAQRIAEHIRLKLLDEPHHEAPLRFFSRVKRTEWTETPDLPPARAHLTAIEDELQLEEALDPYRSSDFDDLDALHDGRAPTLQPQAERDKTGRKLFRCVHPRCPGLPWPATMWAHPCGRSEDEIREEPPTLQIPVGAL